MKFFTRSLLALILILQTSMAHAVGENSADQNPPTPPAKTQNTNNDFGVVEAKSIPFTVTKDDGTTEQRTVEVDAITSTSPEETAKVIAFAKSNLNEVRKKNPKVRASIIQLNLNAADDQNSDEIGALDPQSQADYAAAPAQISPTDADQITQRHSLPKGWLSIIDAPSLQSNQQPQSLAQTAKKFMQKHYRITWTIIRIADATGATTWALVAGQHMPLHIAMTIGFGVGMASGAFQFFAKAFTGKVTSLIKTNPPILGQMTTWFVFETPMVAALFGIEAAFGFAPDHTLLLAAWNILKTSFLSAMSQGAWDTSVMDWATVAAQKKELFQEDIDFTAANRFVLGSAISVLTMVASLVHLNLLADIGFISLGAAGLLRHAHVSGADQRLLNWTKRTYKKISCRALDLI